MSEHLSYTFERALKVFKQFRLKVESVNRRAKNRSRCRRNAHLGLCKLFHVEAEEVNEEYRFRAIPPSRHSMFARALFVAGTRDGTHGLESALL